jgi:hypothetical protein
MPKEVLLIIIDAICKNKKEMMTLVKAYNGSNFTPRPSIVFDRQEKL